MGETYIRVRVRASPTDPTFEEMDLLVDTGAAYSWISSELLNKLGVKPTRQNKFRTIRGDTILRDVGHFFVEYKGEMAPTAVVFAVKEDASVFGLHALESLGLEVDPATMQVRKSEALLAL